jgi:hypothetical protein
VKQTINTKEAVEDDIMKVSKALNEFENCKLAEEGTAWKLEKMKEALDRVKQTSQTSGSRRHHESKFRNFSEFLDFVKLCF